MKKQITIVVGLILNEKRQLLIAKRRDENSKENDNKWEFVGGKIEYGEDPEDALVREMKEESGLDVKIKRLLPKVITNTWTKNDGEEYQVFILCYECEIIGGELHKNEFDHKISELKFVESADIAKHETLKNVLDILALLDK